MTEEEIYQARQQRIKEGRKQCAINPTWGMLQCAWPMCGCDSDVEEARKRPVYAPQLPLTMDLGRPAHYMAPPELDHFYPGDPIRAIEKASIRFFVEKHRGLLKGRVLDFGAGKQPYRDLVEGEYVAFEKGDDTSWQGPTPQFDAIMCNQVLHLVSEPINFLVPFGMWLKTGGHLVITYQTNWPEVDAGDLQRSTMAGMSRMLAEASLEILDHQLRAEIVIGNFRLALGYGVVARKV